MKGLPILMYHQVGYFKGIRTHRATYCKYSRFRLQMAYLRAMDYRVMGLSEGLRLLHKGLLPKRSIVLTFDDGYADFYYLVAPLLRKYGFGATVFVLPDLLGKRAFWLKKEGLPEAPLLSRDMVIELHKEGIEIGSHGLDHRNLSELDDTTLKAELLESRNKLQELLNHEVYTFCYPFGLYDRRVRDATERAGYTWAVTCERGKATKETDPFRLPRIAVSYGDSLAGFIWKLYFKARPVVHNET